MSGTSLDGVDVVAFDMAQQSFVGAYSVAFNESLRDDCLALQAPQENEIAHAQIVANQLADLYAQAINQLRQNLSLTHESIAAAGVHGQTIRHRPEHGYTIQLNQPARIAEQTGLTVVSDFRARDIAAGVVGASACVKRQVVTACRRTWPCRCRWCASGKCGCVCVSAV